MVVLSKCRVLPALALLLTLAHAQYFADMNIKRNRPGLDQDDEDVSAVDKLNASSTWWDYLMAQQKDAFNMGSYRQLRDQFE